MIETADHQSVGCFGLMPLLKSHGGDHSKCTCELRKMYVRRPYRGRGLGRPLMSFALSEARRLGFSRVELDTASQLLEAIHLYRQFGFKDFYHPNIPKRCDRAMALEF